MAACFGGIVLFLTLLCCFCFKLKKGLSDDNDSIFESDAYQARNSTNSNGFNTTKKPLPNNYPPKLIKGVKGNQNLIIFILIHLFAYILFLKKSDLKKSLRTT